jgi:ubiquinone/menaquinone biosynthesis C-methylase UbiE
MTDPAVKKVDISSDEYTSKYYQEGCDGYKEYIASHGQSLPTRLKLPLDLAGIKSDMYLVDIGCGRGEVVFHAAQSGAFVWGIDYSSAAVEIAMSTLKKNLPENIIHRCGIQQCNASWLPFQDSVIDRVFLLDIVEHLRPDELSKTLQESYRVLKQGGFVIIHTMPSLWYYRYGYPIFRLIQRIRRKKLPADPRERCDYSHFHVNEQSLISLRKTLIKNGFTTHVWLQTTQDYSDEKNRFFRTMMRLLVTVYPFRWIFCDDIFALGEKLDG